MNKESEGVKWVPKDEKVDISDSGLSNEQNILEDPIDLLPERSAKKHQTLYEARPDQCCIFGTLFFVSILSVSVGFQTIYSLATFMYMKEELYLRPETITFVMVLIDIPFGIKPVFGYLADILFTKIKKVKHLMFLTSLFK